jgi:DNA end-binding protein Ku
LPRSKKKRKSNTETPNATGGPAARPIWSGTITFGLVSIPVDLMTAVRPRPTAMKLVDKEGHALGRRYHCSKEGIELDNDDLVRGYEAEDGQMIPITDEEFESAAPEMSADIELRNFVPAVQIPPIYFQKSFFLAPAGKSSKAYSLLAATLAKTGRVGIGSFVMRGQEYLVAIVPDHGVLRADALRYADEIRTLESIGLPKRERAPATVVNLFVKDIQSLQRNALDMAEFEDKEAEELQALVKKNEKDSDKVIHQPELELDEIEAPEQGGQVIDLMERLRKSLSTRAVVTNAEHSAPISLAERRARQEAAAEKSPAKKKSRSGKSHRRT